MLCFENGECTYVRAVFCSQPRGVQMNNFYYHLHKLMKKVELWKKYANLQFKKCKWKQEFLYIILKALPPTQWYNISYAMQLDKYFFFKLWIFIDPINKIVC